MRDFSDIVHKPLLIFFGFPGVNDKHNVRNSHTCLSNVGRQHNLRETKQSIVELIMNIVYLFIFTVFLCNTFGSTFLIP